MSNFRSLDHYWNIGSIMHQEETMTPGNKTRWIYWGVTAPFVVTMLIASLMLLSRAQGNVEGITHLVTQSMFAASLERRNSLAASQSFRTVIGQSRSGHMPGTRSTCWERQHPMHLPVIALERSLPRSLSSALSSARTGCGGTPPA